MSKKKTKPDFDIEEALNNYVCSKRLKKGIKYYITSNSLKIESEKDFQKAIDDYKKLTMGD